MSLMLKILAGLACYIGVLSFIGHRLRALHLTADDVHTLLEDAAADAADEQAAQAMESENNVEQARPLGMPVLTSSNVG